MATTVGSHSVSTFNTPVNGGPLDANVVRGNDNTIRTAYVAHDSDTGIHVQSSSLASRPAAGTAGRKWITVDTGSYKLWYDDGTTWHEVGTATIDVFVVAGESLVKGDVVKVTGYNNGLGAPTVAKVASASDVAFGIMNQTVANGATGYLTNTGMIADVATNAFNVGDILYPNTSGGFTATKPTSGNYQPAAFVLRSNSNNGVLYVEFSAPRIVERSDNTASTVVLRDASGNFSAGTITAGALTSTGLVTFASLKGTGATTVTNILDEDNMASDSATALATQQSIKAYVDAKVATVDTLAEVLANGNTTGANNIIVSSGQKITTNTIDETTAAAGVTIDSVLLKDDVVNATDIEVDTISANNGTLAVTLGSTGVATIAQQPILSSLTASQAVFTDASKGLVSNAITGTGNVVMSASPTLTGTVTAATINATTLGGTLSTAAQPNVTSLGTLSSLAVTGNLTLGADVVLSRGAADRLDLASGDSLNVVSGTYKIANTDVLSATTLGSGVTASSLTSVGTLTSLTVSGTTSLSNRIGFSASANLTAAGQIGRQAGTGLALWPVGGTTYDFVMYNAAGTANVMAVPTGTTNAVFDGNLGLGVTPSYQFDLLTPTSATDRQAVRINYGTTVGRAVYFGIDAAVTGTTYIQSATPSSVSSGTDLALNPKGGNVGVGATSPSANYRLTVQGVGTAGNPLGGIAFRQGSTDVMYMGSIDLANTTDFELWNPRNGYTRFGTNGVERARITSGGYFKASNTGTYANATGAYHELRQDAVDQNVVWIVHTAASGAPYGPYIEFSAQSPDNNTSYFLTCRDSTTNRCFIWSDGDLANHDGVYGTISDERLKQDIVDAGSQWDDLKAVRFRKYRMKTDVAADPNAPYQLGVIAQELEQTSPGLVDEHPEYEEQEVTDENGNVTTEKVQVGTTKTVKSSILLMKAAVALQEAMARIEALEARLEALEA